jgi:CheY-like chemotaxis protein
MLGTSQTFWLTPGFKSKDVPPRPEVGQKSENKKNAPLVLVVDDEELVADTTAEILRQNGFRAIAIYDSKRALDLAERCRPEYLLSDVLMPSMDGVELALQIQKVSQSTKVLLFSGQVGASEILENAAAQGYQFDLIPKPVHPDKLIRALRAKK